MFRFNFTLGRLLEVQLIDFPTSTSLTHLFGLGSVLGIYFALQVSTGLLLSFNYVANDSQSFWSILLVIIEANKGNLLYIAHSIGAGTVFLLLYAHMGKFFMIRTLSSYALLTGSILLLLIVISSFLGYVLLWQQMSYWAATVITSLLSVLPDGDELLILLWGNFTLDAITLTRFYSFHYLITLISAALAIVHLIALHILGSTSNYLIQESNDSIGFSRYYLIKDVILFALVFILYNNFLYISPTLFSDPELNISINTMATPPHIVPEWYLLGYYAILRGIPSKLVGIIMVLLVIILLFLGILNTMIIRAV